MANILASKIYNSSSRKDKILGAIQDPKNTELVKQMASYLDEEFIDSKYLNPNASSDKSDMNSDKSVDKHETKDLHSSGSSPHLSHSSGGGSASTFNDLDAMFEDSDDFTAEGEVSDDNVDDSIPVDIDESELDIDSSTAICASISIDEVLGTLNLRDDTKGVSRVLVKDNELWIYYEDDVNLNKVMSEVIKQLLTSGYSYLEFNRLARSNNAVVFDIVEHSKASGGADS